MTPMQALQAATRLAAECLGLGQEIGTIEKGKWADLVVVEGDPLREIRVLQDARRIRRVIKAGVSVTRHDDLIRRGRGTARRARHVLVRLWVLRILFRLLTAV